MRFLRLATGLVVASFVVGHFLNHSLGVVSIEAMDRMRIMLAAWWRSPAGTVLLYGSLLTHFALALVSLYRRSTLRMPLWEALQLALGLAIPPLLDLEKAIGFQCRDVPIVVGEVHPTASPDQQLALVHRNPDGGAIIVDAGVRAVPFAAP